MTEISGGNLTSKEKRFKEFHGDIDIFVPQAQEGDYLSTYGIEIRRLDNGAIIVGATRQVEDEATADVNLFFPSGAYYEPAGKGGINHLLEHVISNKPGLTSRKNDAYFNAVTNVDSITTVIKGIANPNVKNYGIWPVLRPMLGELTNSLEVTEQALENEKGVVLGELHQREAERVEKLRIADNSIIFAKDNPINYSVIGTPSDLASISIADVIKQHGEVFIPKGLEATVFVQGSIEITKEIMDVLTNSLANMHSASLPKTVDDELNAKINPKFAQGKTYSVDLADQNNLIDISYLWLLHTEGYSASAFATSQILNAAGHKMFQYFRESGLGYTAGSSDTGLGSRKRLSGFRMQIPKRELATGYANSLYPLVRERVLASFGDTDMQHINDMIHKRLNAVPTSTSDRFGSVLYGLRNYGRIIDPDKAQEINKMITPDTLKNSLDSLISTNPAITVIGNLS